MELLTTSLSTTRTDMNSFIHPVKAFFEACGLDTSSFPVVKFMIETSEKELRTNRICIPIRLPDAEGVYESFFRITRVLEIPLALGGGHRKFVEVEWLVEPEAFSEIDLHPSNSFLASEMSCPSCRVHFIPDPIILNDTAVKISCPQCLQQWTCKLEPTLGAAKPAQLLLDLLRKDPVELRKMIKSWEEIPSLQADSFYYGFFPYSFEKLDATGSLEWLTEEAQGWSSLSNGQNRSFENIIRGFMNKISLGFIKQIDTISHSSLLEQTDIHRKSEIRKKEESQIRAIDELLPRPTLKESQNIFKSAAAQKSVSKSFSWEPKEFTLTQRQVWMKADPKKSKTLLVIAATIVLTIAGYMSLEYFGSASNTEMTSQAPAIKIAEVSPSHLDTLDVKPPAPEKIEVKKSEEVKKPEVIQPKKVVPKITPKSVVQKLKASMKSEKSKPAKTKVDSDIATKDDLSENEMVAVVPAPAPTPNGAPTIVTDEGSVSEKTFQSEDDTKESDIDATYRQGMLHLKFQQGHEAADLFENILKANPDHALSYRGLGIAYFYDKKYSRSVEALEKYLTVLKDAPDRKNIEEMLRVLKDRLATASLAR